jgi:predicted TIM-barrel fold metal-dependent hydrolase
MYTGTVIDVDIHHTWPNDGDLEPYLSPQWQEYVRAPGRSGPVHMWIESGFTNPHGVFRRDANPPTGGRPGSFLPMVREQLLDRHDVVRGVLTHADALFLAAIPHPMFAADIARAANDFTSQEWLEQDERLTASIVVSGQIPELAVAEIERHAGDPRMVQVIMAGNGVGQPLGHPLLHPIYQACAEHGLPIAIHAFGAAGMMPPCSASGEPSYYIEYHTHGLQGMMTTITSFVTHGVFDRFPELKLVLLEAGVAWVPGFLWRFDNAYRRLRIETPWVKRAPSEYFHDHVRLSTQPLDSPADTHELISALEAYGGEDLLMFASDYPHWDADDVDYVAARLPRDWHAKVFHDNAAQLYGWTGAAASESRERVADHAA